MFLPLCIPHLLCAFTVNRRLGCFRFLPFVTNGALNMGVQLSLNSRFAFFGV